MTKMCLKQKRSGMARGLNGPQTDKVHIFGNILQRCMTVKIDKMLGHEEPGHSC